MGEFDPSRYLTKIRGKGGTSDYLEVKWRLVWFRDRYPHGTIQTEHVTITDTHAVFKATAMCDIGEGHGGMSTGYGSESKSDFGDFIEKAETKAVGRALAMLGFGTQFAPELEEGERIVDSPVARQDAPGEESGEWRSIPAHMPPRTSTGQTSASGNEATEAQRKKLYAMAKERGYTDQAMKTILLSLTSKSSSKELTKSEASQVIDHLSNLEGGR